MYQPTNVTQSARSIDSADDRISNQLMTSLKIQPIV